MPYVYPDLTDRLFLWMSRVVETVWVVAKWPLWLRRIYLVTWPVSMPLRFVGLMVFVITIIAIAVEIALLTHFRDLWNGTDIIDKDTK